MDYNDDDAAESSPSWVATALTPSATKHRTTSQGPSCAAKKPAMRAETTVVGLGHESTSGNTQPTSSSTTNNGDSRGLVPKSTKPCPTTQHRTQPTTVQPSSNGDPSSADTAAQSLETKEVSQHARKTTVNVFSLQDQMPWVKMCSWPATSLAVPWSRHLSIRRQLLLR
ncbi:hypothetical protein BGZ81_002038, partial [Podila clonocystis]